MFRNETTTTTPAVSFRHDEPPRQMPALGGRQNLVSRYLPVPILFGGLVGTAVWMGVCAWWLFSFVRWTIG